MSTKTIFISFLVLILLASLFYFAYDSNAGGFSRSGTATPTASRTNIPTATNTPTFTPTMTSTSTATFTPAEIPTPSGIPTIACGEVEMQSGQSTAYTINLHEDLYGYPSDIFGKLPVQAGRVIFGKNLVTSNFDATLDSKPLFNLLSPGRIVLPSNGMDSLTPCVIYYSGLHDGHVLGVQTTFDVLVNGRIGSSNVTFFLIWVGSRESGQLFRVQAFRNTDSDNDSSNDSGNNENGGTNINPTPEYSCPDNPPPDGCGGSQ
ncbi:MAG: hypothetical protein HXY35_16755 [Chloroflexi bacterium]|nr:hypothetical protein [Chloroflexota bacterium]